MTKTFLGSLHTLAYAICRWLYHLSTHTLTILTVPRPFMPISEFTLSANREERTAYVPPAIDVAGVNHFFGTGEARKQVLFDNELTIRPGEIVIMTGQSGSGKTTLLTLIGTLRRVQEGRLTVLGQPLHDSTSDDLVQLRKRLGFIFQAHNLFSSLTAMENVRMALELHPDRMSRSEANERCREVLEAVGLGERIHYRPRACPEGKSSELPSLVVWYISQKFS